MPKPLVTVNLRVILPFPNCFHGADRLIQATSPPCFSAGAPSSQRNALEMCQRWGGASAVNQQLLGGSQKMSRVVEGRLGVVKDRGKTCTGNLFDDWEKKRVCF